MQGNRQAAFRLGPADKKVIDAFIDGKSGNSNKLESDGKRLDGLWMGGSNVAEWVGGKIQLNETGGKSAQTIHRAIRKMAPRNMLRAASRQGKAILSESSLRNATIKLAHEKPELREHLLPLLVEAGEKQARMSDEARELELYIENDYDLYQRQYMPIIKNLMRKWRKGQYDFEKSIKLFMYLVEAGAKKYDKEFGTPGVKWHVIFPKNVRLEVARSLAESFRDEAEYGGYDDI